MNPRRHDPLRLVLYVVIAFVPGVIDWLTLTDFTPRGLAIIAAKSLLTAAITARAYLDQGAAPE